MRPIPTEPMLEKCERCAKETRHEPDRMGVYHCMTCRERDSRVVARENSKGLLIAGGVLLVLAFAALAYFNSGCMQ